MLTTRPYPASSMGASTASVELSVVHKLLSIVRRMVCSVWWGGCGDHTAAGVVDEDVDSTQFFQSHSDEPFTGPGLAQILDVCGHAPPGVSRQSRRRVFHRRLVGSGEQHRRPFGEESTGHPESDPGRSTGDHGTAPGKPAAAHRMMLTAPAGRSTVMSITARL